MGRFDCTGDKLQSIQASPCILEEFVNPELHVQGRAERKFCCWCLSQGELHWHSKLLYVLRLVMEDTWVNTAWHWVQTSTPKVKRFPQPWGNKPSCLSERCYSPGPERQSNTHAVNFHFKQWDSAAWQGLGKNDDAYCINSVRLLLAAHPFKLENNPFPKLTVVFPLFIAVCFFWYILKEKRNLVWQISLA